MRAATFELYAEKTISLKKQNRRLLSNIFLYPRKLRELMEKKPCLLHDSSSTSLFLLIPYHNYYYDLLFNSTSLVALEDDLRSLLTGFKHNNQPIQVSIPGKEHAAGEISAVFEKTGFALRKKRTRIIHQQISETVTHWLDQINMLNDDQPIFADKEDAQEIVDMLLEAFGLLASNVPELEDIASNIEQRQVVVIRRDGRIAALYYFEVENGQMRGLFEITREEYRKEFIFLKIKSFVNSHLAGLPVQINKRHGWLDASNERLIKMHRTFNTVPDGVYIYVMVWNPEK